MQAWLVPHVPEENAKAGCGVGSTAAVHQGFHVSWGNALKKEVCDVVQQAASQSGRDASNMRVFVTGERLCKLSLECRPWTVQSVKCAAVCKRKRGQSRQLLQQSEIA